jgi:hypothetical protein
MSPAGCITIWLIIVAGFAVIGMLMDRAGGGSGWLGDLAALGLASRRYLSCW